MELAAVLRSTRLEGKKENKKIHVTGKFSHEQKAVCWRETDRETEIQRGSAYLREDRLKICIRQTDRQTET